MTKHSAWFALLATSLAVSASPVLTARQDGDPPGSVVPLQTGDDPAPTANPSLGTEGNGKFQWQIYAKCDDSSKTAIVKAWEDSKVFSDSLYSWKPKADFQPAMDMYMGTRSTYENFLGFDFPQQIQDTAKRHQGLYEGKSSYGNANLWVYCNEDSHWFSHCKTSATGAVIAYEQEDAFFNNCSRPSINMDVIDGPPGFHAGTFFHETMHLSQLVTSPQAKDKAYGAKAVYDLAKNKNTDAAVYNADSWTMVAQAIWAQKQYNLADPPLPEAYSTNGDASAVGNQNLDVMYVNAADVVPEGASPVSDGNYYVDPSQWQIYTPGQGLVPLGTSTPATAPTCDSGSTRDIGPYCYCSSGSSTVTAKPLATPPPGQSQCAYSTLPSGDELLTAIYTSTSFAQPSPTEAPAPYATTGDVGVAGAVDKCRVHVWEYQDCEDDANNLSAQIEIYDAAGNKILNKSDAISINNDNPGEFKSVLENPLRLTGEHQNDYIQFNFGGTAWPSETGDTSAEAWCSVGGWDPTQGPSCWFGYTLSTRQMDCYFPCPWNGSPSSSG